MKEGNGLRVWVAKTKPRNSTKPRRDNVAEMIRALMDGPKTVDDLREFVDLSLLVIREWLNAFHDAGVIRICERVGGACVYEMQPSPFAVPDAPFKDNRPARRASRDSYAQRAASMGVGT